MKSSHIVFRIFVSQQKSNRGIQKSAETKFSTAVVLMKLEVHLEFRSQLERLDLLHSESLTRVNKVLVCCYLSGASASQPELEVLAVIQIAVMSR